MTRTSHFSVKVGYPVYAADFLAEDIIAYAGGGGASRSGVKNAIRVARINPEKQTLDPLGEINLSKDEDAPMCMAVDRKGGRILCGINSSGEKIKAGDNEVLRIFSYSLEEENAESNPRATLKFDRSSGSLPIKDSEQYQKVLRLSPSGHAVISAGTDGSVALQEYPSLQHAWPLGYEEFTGEELYDADFAESGAAVVVASASRLKILSSLPAEANEKGPKVIQAIQNPALGGKASCSFRAARFGRAETSREKLFTIVNAGAQGKGKNQKRKSFVTAWNANTWDLLETRKVSDKPVTVCDISLDGKRLSYASSDLSVGVLDTKALRPMTKILHAHDFPATCIKFSPSGNTLISGSADNTIRIIDISALSVTGGAKSFAWTIVFALLLLLLAIYLQTVL